MKGTQTKPKATHPWRRTYQPRGPLTHPPVLGSWHYRVLKGNR